MRTSVAGRESVGTRMPLRACPVLSTYLYHTLRRRILFICLCNRGRSAWRSSLCCSLVCLFNHVVLSRNNVAVCTCVCIRSVSSRSSTPDSFEAETTDAPTVPTPEPAGTDAAGAVSEAVGLCITPPPIETVAAEASINRPRPGMCASPTALCWWCCSGRGFLCNVLSVDVPLG